MNIREIIRESILRDLTVIEEARKDRWILQNTKLTSDEKNEFIELLIDKPHIEDKILEIIKDWNRFKFYSYDDLKPALTYVSGSEKKKRVKSQGISGLTVGTDYIPVDFDFDPEFNKQDFELELEGVYIPLSWEASKLIASKYIGDIEAPWCIGYQKTDTYWNQYCYGTGEAKPYFADSPSVFMIVVFKGMKVAVQVCSKYGHIIWDIEDKQHGDDNELIPGIDLKKEIQRAQNTLRKVRKYFDDNEPLTTLFRTDGTEIMSFKGKKLSETDYRKQNLQKAKFPSNIDINGCDFSDMNLSGSSFASTSGITQNITAVNTIFSKCDFLYKSLGKSNFSGAKFTEGIYTGTTFDRFNLSNAIFDGCEFMSTTFEECDTKGITFKDSIFNNCQLSTCDFSTATFDNVFFNDGTNLAYSKIVGAKMKEVSISSQLDIFALFGIHSKHSMTHKQEQEFITTAKYLLDNKVELQDKQKLSLIEYALFQYNFDLFSKTMDISTKSIINKDNRRAFAQIFMDDRYAIVKPYMDIIEKYPELLNAIYTYDDTISYVRGALFRMNDEDFEQMIKRLSDVEWEGRSISAIYLWSSWVKKGGDVTDIAKFNTVMKYDKTDSGGLFLADLIEELSTEQLKTIIDRSSEEAPMSSFLRGLSNPYNSNYHPEVVDYFLTKFPNIQLSPRTLQGFEKMKDAEITAVLSKHGYQLGEQ